MPDPGKKIKTQQEEDRERELARRKAHKEAAEKAVNIIVHSPAKS